MTSYASSVAEVQLLGRAQTVLHMTFDVVEARQRKEDVGGWDSNHLVALEAGVESPHHQWSVLCVRVDAIRVPSTDRYTTDWVSQHLHQEGVLTASFCERSS